MKRTRTALAAAALFLATTTIAAAGELEDALRAGWVDSWVTIKTEFRADCLDCYTKNRVSGSGVSSKGVRRFAAGELGRVVELDAHRRRVDLAIELAEPLRVNAPYGPFVLLAERPCRIEIEIERQEMEEKSVAVVERRLGEILERFPTLAEARASSSWNGRTTAPLPPDYEARLRAVLEWQASWEERTQPRVLEVARATMPRQTDHDYLEGFAKGLEYADDLERGGCAELPQLPLPSAPPYAGALRGTEAETRSQGRSDGFAFATALRMLGAMARCRAATAEVEE